MTADTARSGSGKLWDSPPASVQDRAGRRTAAVRWTPLHLQPQSVQGPDHVLTMHPEFLIQGPQRQFTGEQYIDAAQFT